MTEPTAQTKVELADELERLCCAETEGKFFDCVTDNIGTIIAALRSAAAPDVREAVIEAEIERLRGRLKQISAVCEDNLHSGQPAQRLALGFILQLAIP
jgi:hypothetical protein